MADPVDAPEELEDADVAVAAYRENGEWCLVELASDLLDDVRTIEHALRRFPGDVGAIGLVSIDEDFFLILRVAGPLTRLLLSDVTAADEWELAASALDHLRLPMPEDDDEQVPAGDLDLLADLGLHAVDLGKLLDLTDDDGEDLYPEELLSEVAGRLGFGEVFDDLVGLTPA